jgi:acyl-lipid omega-6 desaturase (Delta-12 desaturase)
MGNECRFGNSLCYHGFGDLVRYFRDYSSFDSLCCSTSGLWLFYLQHQYEDVSWFRNKEWNYRTVALKGSSFVKFPKLLQWFSGNIGFHHIHHPNARIPNYYLSKCQRENAILKKVKPVTFMMSLR